MPASPKSPLLRAKLSDPFGRAIDYLRLSVTDQCNFACLYCVPPEGLPCAVNEKLSPEDFERIGRVAVELGFRKIRLTGGEPLVRRDIGELIARLAALTPRPKIALTTNGFWLQERLPKLLAAGLQSVNVSLDSLDPVRFEEITRRRGLADVLRGIHAALAAGLEVKTNCVVMRGMREHDLFGFVDLAREYDFEVRFLEFMPLCGTGWSSELHVPLAEIRSTIDEKFGLLPLDHPKDQPATVFALRGGRGCIGFIASLTEPFCESCSRMRVTSDGMIRPCLFSEQAYDLKPALAAGDDQALSDVFRQAVFEKPRGHGWSDQAARPLTSYPLIHNIGG